MPDARTLRIVGDGTSAVHAGVPKLRLALAPKAHGIRLTFWWPVCCVPGSTRRKNECEIWPFIVSPTSPPGDDVVRAHGRDGALRQTKATPAHSLERSPAKALGANVGAFVTFVDWVIELPVFMMLGWHTVPAESTVSPDLHNNKHDVFGIGPDVT